MTEASPTRRGRATGEPCRRVLAVASSGGHWSELVRLAPALAGHDVTWVTTSPGYRGGCPPGGFRTVRDASMWDKPGLVILFGQMVGLVLRLRPDCVISTGAAPGWFAVVVGRLIGARTVWIDSLANSDELSLSGRRAGPWVDLWLTQWAHLARPNGPHYAGSVL